MKADCFMVIARGQKRGTVTVRRTTRRRPQLAHDEALILLSLDIPDNVFDAPLVTVPVAMREVAVAVEVLPAEDSPA